MKLDEKLYELRKKNGWSQEELADKLEVSRQTVSKWESNKAIPELEKLVKLSDIYNISLDELVKNVSNKDVFYKKKKIKKILKVLLIIALIALIIGSVVFTIFIKERINIVNEIGDRYKENYAVIGETKSGFVKEITVKEDKNSVEGIYRDYYYYVSDSERLVKIECFEDKEFTNLIEKIYIDLNKENRDLLFDDVIKINVRTGVREEIDNYEFNSPIIKTTDALNSDRGMIWEWDDNPDAKEIAFDMKNKFAKEDGALGWANENINESECNIQMVMGLDSLGVHYERYDDYFGEEREVIFINIMSDSLGEITRENVIE